MTFRKVMPKLQDVATKAKSKGVALGIYGKLEAFTNNTISNGGKNMNYKLADDIFYRLYGENTLLYQTGQGKVYVYSSTAKDILDFFKEENRAVAFVENLKSNGYVISDDEEKGICGFIEELSEKGILQAEYKLKREIDNVETKFRENMLPKGQLYSAMFELTYRCNEKCRYCYCCTDDKNELTTDEIKKALNELYEMNVFDITFTGGDPFIRKDTFEILEYAKSKNFLINIFTNGIALTDDDIFRLQKLHPRSIHFTLYSHVAEKHDWFTQVPGSFGRTVGAIKKCLTLGIPVNVKSTVMDFNLPEIEQLMQFVEGLGASIQVGISVSAKNDGDLSPVQFRLKTKEEYKEALVKIHKNIEVTCGADYKFESGESRSICDAGKRAININPYGNVNPCNALQINCGNIREKSIKNIWEYSEELQKVRDFKMCDIKGCNGCDKLEYCTFCPGSALTETGDPLQSYKDVCLAAEAREDL